MPWLLLLTLACETEPPPSVPAKAMEPVAAPEPATPAAAPALPEGANPALLDSSKATATAPASFTVRFETTKGEFEVEVDRSWSPQGADRFYNLVDIGYFDDIRFFRVIPGFMVQFGINGLPSVNDEWKDANIDDDPVVQSNTRGMVSFAKTNAPNSRSTQVFINFGNNKNLDGMGFSPFGKVVKGMDVVDALYSGYGEGAPKGTGPWQHRVQSEGNAYLDKDFPKMDKIIKAAVVQ